MIMQQSLSNDKMFSIMTLFSRLLLLHYSHMNSYSKWEHICFLVILYHNVELTPSAITMMLLGSPGRPRLQAPMNIFTVFPVPSFTYYHINCSSINNYLSNLVTIIFQYYENFNRLKNICRECVWQQWQKKSKISETKSSWKQIK